MNFSDGPRNGSWIDKQDCGSDHGGRNTKSQLRPVWGKTSLAIRLEVNLQVWNSLEEASSLL